MTAYPPYFRRWWQNQPVALYHGTTDDQVQSILQGIDINMSRADSDFGRGFYTTTVERQAHSWAWLLSQRRPNTQPAVLRFNVDRDELAALQCLWFVRGSFDADEFWSLIFHCRMGGGSHARQPNQEWYDIVVGPVAASWRQRLIIYDADQVSFHTNQSVGLLMRSEPRRIL